MKPEIRKAAIMEAAFRVAERLNYSRMTLQDVADEAGCHRTLVTHYYPQNLAEEIMKAAAKHRNLVIIGQGLAMRDPIALALSTEIKLRAARSLIDG